MFLVSPDEPEGDFLALFFTSMKSIECSYIPIGTVEAPDTYVIVSDNCSFRLTCGVQLMTTALFD